MTDLFTFLDEARARGTDPWTSHAASRSVNIARTRQQVLDILREIGPCSDEQLVDSCRTRFDISPSGVRTRRHELAVAGLVIEAGEAKTRSGRTCLTWRAA